MRYSGVVWGLMLLSLLSLGCGTKVEQSKPEGEGPVVSDLAGSIAIDGSSTVYPISEKVAEEFKTTFPQVATSVGLSGTGGGFEKFMVGTIDISDASRPVKASEIEKGKEKNIEFVEIPVAFDGLSIVVHPSNDWVKSLTVDQLKKIFLSDAPAQNWSDVDPTWPNAPIKLFIPGTDSGTFDYFKEVVAGKEGSIRSEGVSTDENDNTLVGSIAAEPNALGFFGAAYYFTNRDRVRAVPIVNPKSSEAVEPTPETIENGSYAPFGRPLFIYANVKSLERLEVEKFIDFYLTNAARIAAEVGYVSLPEEIYAKARERFENRTTGTLFLDAQGETVKGTLREIYGVAETSAP